MKKILALVAASLSMTLSITGCGRTDDSPPVQSVGSQQSETANTPTSEIKELENGFSAVQFEGDDGFEAFLAGGGASSDGEVVAFLSSELLAGFDILGSLFGCSTIAAAGP